MFKKIATATLTATLLASAVPVYAQSMSTDVGAGVNAGVSTGGAAMKSDMKAQGSADMTVGSVVSTIRQGQPVPLEKINAQTQVEIVDVASLKGEGAANTTAIDGALKANQTQVDQLQADISANATVKQKLEAEGFEPVDVVAANTATDGTLTLYVWNHA